MVGELGLGSVRLKPFPHEIRVTFGSVRATFGTVRVQLLNARVVFGRRSGTFGCIIENIEIVKHIK